MTIVYRIGLLLAVFNWWYVGKTAVGDEQELTPNEKPAASMAKPAAGPLWNAYSKNFIYAPSFAVEGTSNADHFRYVVTNAEGEQVDFTSTSADASLAPVWDGLPEGLTRVTVEALDASNNPTARLLERTFYKSPDFTGEVSPPPIPYAEAARKGYQAIFEASHVQHWLEDGRPDQDYKRYCYPSKVIGGLVRAMAAYSQTAEKPVDREKALEIGRRAADYLLANRYPDGTPFAGCPPTYLIDVEPTKVGRERFEKGYFMVPSVVDAALAFLDMYDVTHDEKYLNACLTIAEVLQDHQLENGTWPLLVNWRTGETLSPQLQSATWIIFFLDRLHDEYEIDTYRDVRSRAWAWIVNNPLKTYRWDGQFEDIKPHAPYRNLSREQACDTAVLLMRLPDRSPEDLANAEALIRFSEDQFVIWSPVKDPQAWMQLCGSKYDPAEWITPCVLEQYAFRVPIARSSAVLIETYLVAYEVTGKPQYMEKAKALAHALIEAQRWFAETRDGNGEIPTRLTKDAVVNWVNNSYYAAASLQTLDSAARHASVDD